MMIYHEDLPDSSVLMGIQMDLNLHAQSNQPLNLLAKNLQRHYSI